MEGSDFILQQQRYDFSPVSYNCEAYKEHLKTQVINHGSLAADKTFLVVILLSYSYHERQPNSKPLYITCMRSCNSRENFSLVVSNPIILVYSHGMPDIMLRFTACKWHNHTIREWVLEHQNDTHT
jgi:hypothetical protein